VEKLSLRRGCSKRKMFFRLRRALPAPTSKNICTACSLDRGQLVPPPGGLPGPPPPWMLQKKNFAPAASCLPTPPHLRSPKICTACSLERGQLVPPPGGLPGPPSGGPGGLPGGGKGGGAGGGITRLEQCLHLRRFLQFLGRFLPTLWGFTSSYSGHPIGGAKSCPGVPFQCHKMSASPGRAVRQSRKL
jgi:hypothetical protein